MEFPNLKRYRDVTELPFFFETIFPMCAINRVRVRNFFENIGNTVTF